MLYRVPPRGDPPKSALANDAPSGLAVDREPGTRIYKCVDASRCHYAVGTGPVPDVACPICTGIQTRGQKLCFQSTTDAVSRSDLSNQLSELISLVLRYHVGRDLHVLPLCGPWYRHKLRKKTLFGSGCLVCRPLMRVKWVYKVFRLVKIALGKSSTLLPGSRRPYGQGTVAIDGDTVGTRIRGKHENAYRERLKRRITGIRRGPRLPRKTGK